ncbi:MAG: efflux RND transporter permease subunit, partial [Candidatus Aminicenantes bacterium]|nr:efflux RND transporter permease subunit [Candidatus Aminicenantes bacterium]
VKYAILEGSILVLLVLFLFLGNLRGAMIVIMAMPLTVLATFVFARIFNLGANLMSLGGLAISIGMIVDASIIQVENVERHLAERGRNRDRLKDILQAVLEVRRPSIFGEMIIVLTFLPILSLQGIEGKMFSPLAIMVAIALFCSLLLSIFVVPVFCYYLMRPKERKTETLLAKITRQIYLPILNLSLQFRWAVLLLALILLLGAIYLYPRLGREFVPVMDEGAFDMDIQLLPGISLEQALAIDALVEKKLKEFPELEIIVGRTGQTGVAIEARGVDKTGHVGSLRPRSEWKNARNWNELVEKMRAVLEPIPGMVFSFSQPIQCRIDELVAGTRSQLILKIFGEDLTILREKAAEIASILAEIRGATDLVIEQVAGQLYLQVEIDRQRMARYGLRTRDVLDVVEVAIGGKVATTYFEGNKYFDLVVKFPEDYRNSPEKIKDILIRTAQGIFIPLAEVAQIELKEGPVQISRENGFRRIGIELNVAGRDIGSFVSEAKRRIKEEVSLPPGMTLAWGGQFENQQRAMRRLMIITPIVLGMILIFLFITFGSFRLVLILLVSLPLALVGGVFSLWLSGQYLSVPASVGFIALLGIAVLNGIVLLNQIMLEEQKRRNVRECILGACAIRLRPILMTAATTILGLTPLLAATGPGSEIQRPLAIVVVGGLTTSTLLTLIVLPVLASFRKYSK